MPFTEGQPRLMGCLAWVPLKQVVNKNLLGGRWLTQYNLFTALSFQYESGAIIGRAKCDELILLEKMLGNPTVEGELVKACKDKARKRLNEFKAEGGKEPDDFKEFIFDREFKKAAGMSYSDCLWKAVSSQNKNLLLKPCLEKIPLEKAEAHLYSFGLEGIGFGSSFPELTEKMSRNQYEKKIDLDEWTEARTRFGLDIPEKPDEMTFVEREESILGVVALYAEEFYPELVDPLDLRKYLGSRE